MAETKTKIKPTTTSVDGYLDMIPHQQRRKDCKALVKIMNRVTGEKPVLWGPSIVGFGRYHYKHASGHEGDASATDNGWGSPSTSSIATAIART